MDAAAGGGAGSAYHGPSPTRTHITHFYCTLFFRGLSRTILSDLVYCLVCVHIKPHMPVHTKPRISVHTKPHMSVEPLFLWVWAVTQDDELDNRRRPRTLGEGCGGEGVGEGGEWEGGVTHCESGGVREAAATRCQHQQRGRGTEAGFRAQTRGGILWVVRGRRACLCGLTHPSLPPLFPPHLCLPPQSCTTRVLGLQLLGRVGSGACGVGCPSMARTVHPLTH